MLLCRVKGLLLVEPGAVAVLEFGGSSNASFDLAESGGLSAERGGCDGEGDACGVAGGSQIGGGGDGLCR